MNPLDCQEVAEHLEEFAAGECAAPLAEAVERHLAGCPSCRRKHGDAERLLGLLDWHFQADEALERLQTVLRQEQRGAVPRRLVPFARRLAAAAALLLVLVGLSGWLVPRPEERPALVASLRQAGPESAPGAGHKALADTVVVRTFTLARGGRSPKALREELQAAARTGQLPPPPRIDLALEVRNRGDRPLYLEIGVPGTELTLDLRGPGVLRLPAAGMPIPPFLAPRRVRLAPGASYFLPIDCLVGGSRGHLSALYWTAPGRYTLTARYRVGTSSVPADGDRESRAWALHTFTSPPVTVQVEPH